MTDEQAARLKVLEATALRAQQDAGRAWAELQSDDADESQETWDRLNANYEAAKKIQDDAYAAWKAAGGQ